MMFGLGKKKEVPLKEQPGYGTVKHFYDYAVAEAEKNIKKYGINKKEYVSICFTPFNNEYLLMYSAGGRGISMRLVREDGRSGDPVLGLAYDENGELSSVSHVGSNFKGKETAKAYIDDDFYHFASSETIVPAFATTKTPDGYISYALEATNEKIQWQGIGYNSGQIGGMHGDPRNILQTM